MGDKQDTESLAAKFSKHLKLNANGLMVMRARDKETREAWANLNDSAREGAKLLALIRISRELEVRAAAVNNRG
jgi:hypothetical protein